jgi:hypothetical protein
MLIVSFISPDIDRSPTFRHFERMAVHVDRMLVAARVLHHQPVALAALDGEQRVRLGP